MQAGGEVMAPSRKTPDHSRLDRVVAEARRNREQRERGYREQALRLFPWVCAKCGREFSRETLNGLTVHHKDHNHDNNPPDGSNWELLCLYCHDNEHARYLDAPASTATPDAPSAPASSHRPFADLQSLLKKGK